ncbi:hypothetical protein Csa_023756 [Cucumis sativus]|nr:hypothetical protein Csa_023756 [Cucumis sativus]
MKPQRIPIHHNFLNKTIPSPNFSKCFKLPASCVGTNLSLASVVSSRTPADFDFGLMLGSVLRDGRRGDD